MKLNKKYIKIKDLTISYLDNNLENKKSLVFVHGWGADKDNLKSIYFPLLNDFRIISIDLPGFGESSMPDEIYGSKEYAGILADFFTFLKLNDINYIGHSFGGKIGLLLSIYHKNLIKRLVLISSNGIKPKINIIRLIRIYSFKLLKFFYINILKDKNKIEALKNKYGSDDYKNAGKMRNILVKTVQEDFTKMLDQIDCPVFLYWGDKDEATPLWMAKKMNRLIKDSAIYIVKNGTHFPFLQDNRITSIIKAFAV